MGSTQILAIFFLFAQVKDLFRCASKPVSESTWFLLMNLLALRLELVFFSTKLLSIFSHHSLIIFVAILLFGENFLGFLILPLTIS